MIFFFPPYSLSTSWNQSFLFSQVNSKSWTFLCSEERARTEWGFLIWVSFLSLLLSLGLKFQLCHVKGSGQDLTTSIRHLWDTGRQKCVERARNREKEEPDKLMNAGIKMTPQTRHYSTAKSPLFPQLFYCWDLQAWPKHPGIFFVFADTSSFSHHSHPLSWLASRSRLSKGIYILQGICTNSPLPTFQGN